MPGVVSVHVLRTLVAEGRVEEAVAVLESDWIGRWYSVGPVALRDLVGTFDLTTIARRPVLRLVAVGSGLVTGAEAWALVDHAMGEVRRGGRPDDDVLVAHLLAAVQHRESGQYLQARLILDAARPVADRVGVMSEDAGELALLAFLRLQEGLTALLGGDVAGARHLLQAAHDAEGLRGSAAGRAQVAAHLALACAVAGELVEADDALATAEALEAEIGGSVAATADAIRLARLVLLLDRRQLPEAGRLVQGRKPASYGSLWPLALWSHAQFLLLTGRHRHGLRLLARAEEVVPLGKVGDGIAHEIKRAARAEFNIALGNVREAWVAIEPGTSRTPWSAVAEAMVLYVSGEFETVRYAARVARAAHDLTLRDAARLRALEAAACIARGDVEGARRLLGVVLDTAQQQGWRSYVSSLPRPLVAFALREDWLPADVAASALDAVWTPGPALAAPLSPRERAVFRLLLEGAARAEIADQLGVSINTVKSQVRSLYAKLGVTSRPEVLQKVALMPPAWTYDVPGWPEV